MVSPGGLSYVGRSKELLGKIPAAIAIKRTLLDEAIAMCAKKLVKLLAYTLIYIMHSVCRYVTYCVCK